MTKTTATTHRPRDMRAYQAERRTHAATLYFSSREEMERFRALATSAGYAKNFNAWILVQIHNAASGHLYPPDYVDALKREIEKLRAWLDKARDEAEEYRAQIRTLQGQRDTAVVLLAGLPDGAELAKRFVPKSEGASA